MLDLHTTFNVGFYWTRQLLTKHEDGMWQTECLRAIGGIYSVVLDKSFVVGLGFSNIHILEIFILDDDL